MCAKEFWNQELAPKISLMQSRYTLCRIWIWNPEMDTRRFHNDWHKEQKIICQKRIPPPKIKHSSAVYITYICREGLIGGIDCYKHECTMLTQYLHNITSYHLAFIAKHSELLKTYGSVPYINSPRRGV